MQVVNGPSSGHRGRPRLTVPHQRRTARLPIPRTGDATHSPASTPNGLVTGLVAALGPETRLPRPFRGRGRSASGPQPQERDRHARLRIELERRPKPRFRTLRSRRIGSDRGAGGRLGSATHSPVFAPDRPRGRSNEDPRAGNATVTLDPLPRTVRRRPPARKRDPQSRVGVLRRHPRIRAAHMAAMIRNGPNGT